MKNITEGHESPDKILDFRHNSMSDLVAVGYKMLLICR